MEPKDTRKEFLLHMYNQLFNDINRHIVIIWQSFGTLIGVIALLALTEKGLISLNIAVSLILIICTWLEANLFDASYWYNRKLAIIANIERQFLTSDDLKLVHYYFGEHRPNNKMITHFRIQFYFSLSIEILFIIYHLYHKVIDSFYFSTDLGSLDAGKILPYIILVASIVVLRRLKYHRDKSYKEFLENSPGLEMAKRTDINYGIGHGF